MDNKINILISCGARFIERYLIKELLKNSNNNIICIDNLITVSLNNIKEKIDYIYHFASIASLNKYKNNY